MAHFDRERIPERVVHAKGAGTHGYFQVYKSMAPYTKAQFLQNPEKRIPVFVRFSTVTGGRGSADTVRDISPEKVWAILRGVQKEEYFLVDVRTPAKYEEEHLPGAKFIPLNELDQRYGELDRQKKGGDN